MGGLNTQTNSILEKIEAEAQALAAVARNGFANQDERMTGFEMQLGENSKMLQQVDHDLQFVAEKTLGPEMLADLKASRSG